MNKFGQFCISYLMFLTLGTFLLIGVKSLSNERIDDNVMRSAKYLEQEGLYPKYGMPLWKLDNFTDSWMLNISYTNDSTSYFTQILTDPYYDEENKTKIEVLSYSSNPDYHKAEPYQYYGRYWHGYQITLRPLLLIMDYRGIRIVNFCVLFILFAVSIIGLYKNLSLIYLLAYLASFCLFFLPIGPISLQFSSCFIIALFLIDYILLCNKKILGKQISVLFFITGMATSFFDLLTVPLVTLCLPLIIYGGIKHGLTIKETILLSISWAIGYILLWATKWLLASIFTDINFLVDGLQHVNLRTNGSFMEESDMLVSWGVISISILVFFSCMVLFLIIQRRKVHTHKMSGENIFPDYLLLIASYTPLWFLLIRNHSILHIWFTYRSWIATFFALILFCYYSKNEKYRSSHSLSERGEIGRKGCDSV